jgi:hypothetical protein
MHTIPAVLIMSCALLTGCSGATPTAAASCPQVAAILDGYLYAGGAAAQGEQAGAQVGLIQRSRECVDLVALVEGEPAPVMESWKDGDASGLNAGTVLYSALGHQDGSVLVALDSHGTLIVLHRQNKIRYGRRPRGRGQR